MSNSMFPLSSPSSSSTLTEKSVTLETPIDLSNTQGICYNRFRSMFPISTVVHNDLSHEQFGFRELYNLFLSQQLCDVTLRIFVDGNAADGTGAAGSGGGGDGGAGGGSGHHSIASVCQKVSTTPSPSAASTPMPHEISCHRVVLACYSCYFSAMFKSNMIESHSEVVTMYNIDPQAMEDLIQFCYTGYLRLSSQNVISIMHTACVLQMERAIPFCEQFVLNNLSVEHALDIRKFADLYHLQNLMKEVERFMAINFVTMMNLNGAKEMPFEMLCSVLRHKQLIARSEVEVANSVLKWVGYDFHQRKNHFSKLVLLLHLLHLPYEYLDGNIYIPEVHSDKAAEVYCRSVLRLMMHSKDQRPNAVQDMARMIFQVIGPLPLALQGSSNSERTNTPRSGIEPTSASDHSQPPSSTHNEQIHHHDLLSMEVTLNESSNSVSAANFLAVNRLNDDSTGSESNVLLLNESSDTAPSHADSASLPYSVEDTPLFSQLDYSPSVSQDNANQTEALSSNSSESFLRISTPPLSGAYFGLSTIDRFIRRPGSTSSSSRNALRDASQLGMNPNAVSPVPSSSLLGGGDDRTSTSVAGITNYFSSTAPRLTTMGSSSSSTLPLFSSSLPHYLQPSSSTTEDSSRKVLEDLFVEGSASYVTKVKEAEADLYLEYLDLMRPRSSYTGVVLCVGGRGCPNTPYAEVEVYDPLTEAWYNMPKMLTPRRHVGLIAFGDQVYAIGGHDGRRHLASGEAFAASDGRWLNMQPMNTPRRGLALAWLGNTLFCLGGLDDSSCFKTVERFNFSTNQWHNMCSMRSHRGGLAVATIRDHIIAMGGNDSHTSVNTCEMFDPYSQTWQPIASMSDKRAGASGTMVDGVVYVIGGFDDNMPLSSIERFDERVGRWTQLAPMRHARGGVGAAALGGKIYAVGGHDGEAYLSSTEVYDPAMNRWRDGASLQTQRAGGGVCAFDIPLREFMPSLSPLSDSVV